MRFAFVVTVGVGVWALFGEPTRLVANLLYPDKSAPWEEVVGFFYLDEHDPTEFIESPSLETVDACRNWALEKAHENGERGGYACAIGGLRPGNDKHAYRLIIE